MPPPRGKGRFSKDKKPKRNQQSLLFRRKRFCRFTVAGVEQIDYKDIDTLRDFIAENGKITPARLTGTRACFQRQLTTAMRARNFASLAAVSSRASSARQPDFMTLWNSSAFQRRAYQPSFSTAAARSSTGRLVTSLQSIGLRPGGGSSSRAWM